MHHKLVTLNKSVPINHGAAHSKRQRWRPLINRHGAMARKKRILHQVLGGYSDANVRFDTLRRLLRKLGFAERQRGSHHIFHKEGVPERLVLQRDGSHAKPYQVRQVRKVILTYQLGERE